MTFHTNPLCKVKKQKAPEKVKNSLSTGQFSYQTELNGWTVKAYEEEALQIVTNESHDETKSMVNLSQVPSAAGVTSCVTFALKQSPMEVI